MKFNRISNSVYNVNNVFYLPLFPLKNHFPPLLYGELLSIFIKETSTQMQCLTFAWKIHQKYFKLIKNI